MCRLYPASDRGEQCKRQRYSRTCWIISTCQKYIVIALACQGVSGSREKGTESRYGRLIGLCGPRTGEVDCSDCTHPGPVELAQPGAHTNGAHLVAQRPELAQEPPAD